MSKSVKVPLYFTFLATAAIVATVLFCIDSRPMHAQPRERSGFGDASLNGAYALVGTGGANEAASVGVTHFDGAGGASRRLILNEADPNGSGRLLLTITATRSYQVNPDGTGTAMFLNELPDGTKVPFHLDFVITEAERGGARGFLFAEKVHMVQREPGIAAKLVIFELTWRPE